MDSQEFFLTYQDMLRKKVIKNLPGKKKEFTRRDSHFQVTDAYIAPTLNS